MPIDWQPLKKIVAEAESFVLTSHMRPDCDALGSELGMALALESLGKRVRIVNGDTTPESIAFIDPERRIETLASGAAAPEADVFMVLDTGSWQQLGPMADQLRSAKGTRVVIDHHISGDDLGAVMFKDAKAEATGRLVLEAAHALGAKLSEAMARPLLAAIATDTGWFRFDSVGAATLRAAAELVDTGAKPSELFSSLYDRNSLARVRLHGRILAGMRLAADGRLAVGVARAEDFAATGAIASDTEDVVNRLLSVEGVEAAIMVVELSGQLAKASLRSRSDLDVRQIAETFGGGGHAKAAGVRVEAGIDEAQRVLAEAVTAALGA
ncbi:NanoRNase/pAp phosphatase [Pirellulimonas nuda]|uniref:NanoRNase/pAp phosphatase n=1 Tax=Pirellulimonas nuda TaxID=2528009 RepID=A0A518D7J3_9BACT|nr:DHH family phosphoesterase [Pirellulimonas nuda]QDU87454.1 NanoRNase/pAp phosphatase [Pirellulimonas nuda]